jgi:predicted kinase
LAIALLAQPAARLVAIGGLSGSGKSTLAQALAAGFAPAPGARVIRSDVLRKRLMNVAPESRLPPASYTPEAAARGYGAMRAEAAASVAAGFSAIADATFLRPGERRDIAEVARAAGVPFIGLWLDAPAAALARRLDARRDDASDADAAVLAWQTGIDLGKMDWHRIDASSGPAETIAAARRIVEA